MPLSSNLTFVTIKCFSLFLGCRAVHLLFSRVLGAILFNFLALFGIRLSDRILRVRI